MDYALILVIFLGGIILIVKGGDWFVDAASYIAEVSGIPKLIVGATIVSLATTLPEMLVSAMPFRGRRTCPWATPWAASPPTWDSLWPCR